MHNGPRCLACVGGYSILIGYRLMEDFSEINKTQRSHRKCEITCWSINSVPQSQTINVRRWESDIRGCHNGIPNDKSLDIRCQIILSWIIFSALKGIMRAILVWDFVNVMVH